MCVAVQTAQNIEQSTKLSELWMVPVSCGQNRVKHTLKHVLVDCRSVYRFQSKQAIHLIMIIIFRNIYLYCITNTEHTESRTTNWKSIEHGSHNNRCSLATTTHACGHGIDGIFSVLELYYDDACHGRSPQTPIKCFSNNNHSRTHWNVVVKSRCRMECHNESTRKNSIGHSIRNCQQFRIEPQNYAKWKPRTHSHIWQKHRYVATDHWLLWPGSVYVCVWSNRLFKNQIW